MKKASYLNNYFFYIKQIYILSFDDKCDSNLLLLAILYKYFIF